MYPEDIPYYFREDQFLEHRKMLKDMKQYYKYLYGNYSSDLNDLQKEYRRLDHYYRKWREKQATKR